MVTDDFNFSTSNTPEFNSGISYLERINNIMNKIHESIAIENYKLARSLLFSLYVEIAPRSTPEERGKIMDSFKKLDALLKPSKYAGMIESVQQYNIINLLEALFMDLSILAHTLQLIMPNKAGFIDDE